MKPTQNQFCFDPRSVIRNLSVGLTLPWLAVASFAGTLMVSIASNSVDIGTGTCTSWTVSAGGAIDATPYRPDSSPRIAITSDFLRTGAFLQGGSLANFDGFWVAKCNFFLPQQATNVSLTYWNLAADDRVVLKLNGSPIAATGLQAYSSGIYQGQMLLVDGGPTVNYNFTGPDSGISGTVTNGFNIGATNTLEAIVNNTDHGVYGNACTFQDQIDGVTFQMSGIVSYGINQPFLSIRSSQVEICWNSYSNTLYNVQYRSDLITNNWEDLFTNILATNNETCVFDDLPCGRPQRYYRVIVQP